MRGLGEEEVGDDEEVQGVESLCDMAGVRGRHHRIERRNQQHSDSGVGAQPVEQLVGRDARTGQLIGIDPPHRGDVRAVGWIRQLAVAG
ncbi:MAG: hypothetical protein ACRDRQ_22595 [Pseudonocardiaceae bacterium]